jgi:hypothetical protein
MTHIPGLDDYLTTEPEHSVDPDAPFEVLDLSVLDPADGWEGKWGVVDARDGEDAIPLPEHVRNTETEAQALADMLNAEMPQPVLHDDPDPDYATSNADSGR